MKKKLRKMYIDRRCNLRKTEIEIKSKELLELFKIFENQLRGKNIFIFIDFKKEVHTRPIIEYLKTIDCKIFIPRIEESTHQMEIHPYVSHDSLVISRYGILEPQQNSDAVISPEILDVVITPGVAFDLEGYRIGYGGGYYDRLFARIGNKVIKIAIGFEIQIAPTLPRDSYDWKVDYLVTENHTYSFEK
jgi:5-formyltetrahydrofolate cyclo-ligase